MKLTLPIQLLALAVLFGSESAFPGESLPTELLAGEVLSEFTHTSESGGAARARALFHAPAEQVWETVLSCKAAFTCSSKPE